MASLPVLDPATVAERTGSAYPASLGERCQGRAKQALGNELGLTHFGVNLTRIEPGSWSALRHWHTRQDEFVYVLQGVLVLVTDAGEQTLRAGTAAGFPAGKADGHHLVNRSTVPAVYLEVGDRVPGDEVHYPDADLFVTADFVMHHRNGEPY
jgi:uncharacterized cupin superfamily protein